MRKAIAVFFIIISILSISSVYATNTNIEGEIISNETKSQLLKILYEFKDNEDILFGYQLVRDYINFCNITFLSIISK